jgi:deoxyribonuclease-2
MNRRIFFIACVQLFVGVLSIAERLGCRDESGNLVDWFYLYKLPSSLEGDKNLQQTHSGLSYLYITPSSMSQWKMSPLLINDSQSMPGLTLSPVYKEKGSGDSLVMMYNDEPPEGQTDGSRGHTKGVVFANDISGFWLVHSVPKFPPTASDGNYDYPKTGTIYGQSFLCISFTGDQMGKVGKQLKFNEPHFYSSHVPEYLKT